MRRIYQIISWVALAATIVPSILFFTGSSTLDQAKATMLIATLVWFCFTPLWMGREVR